MAISQIVQNSLANTISLGPKITSVQVANSTYVVKDDTAINIGGGYIVITGSGFQSNCSVLVDSNLACSVAFVSATQVRAELPAKPAGTYNIYVLNGDGGTAIRVNALQYSNTPIWVTASPLTSQLEDTNVSIQLSATGANTYALQSGSTLPTGLTLSANGLISGTVNTNVTTATTFNFTVEAIDTENQETPKAFAVTITVQQQISRSLRFNSADSAYLSRTPGSTGNRKTWTWSAWVKRSIITNDYQRVFSARGEAGELTEIVFNNDGGSQDCLVIENFISSSQSRMVTSAVFRDVSAWYHIVVAYDTTQATNTNRVKLWVNGVQQTFGSGTYPTLNQDTYVNSTYQHRIGNGISYAVPFSGYMAEIHFVDGTALTPDTFGRWDNGFGGTWVPTYVTGVTYGTNGFYLPFTDNSGTTSTTLGKDSAGSNNWTPTNFSVTAGSGNDSLLDSPTPYGTDDGSGADVRGSYCVLNPLDRGSNLTFSEGNLRVVGSGNPNNNCRGTVGVKSGKWYWECVVASGVPGSVFGIAGDTCSMTANFSGDMYAYDSNGNKVVNGTSSGYGASYIANDLIGIAFDADNLSITFYKNNVSQGTITGITSGLTWRPFVHANGVTVDANFGQRPFAYTAPSGYKCLVSENITPEINANSSSTLANSYFDVVTYTGNGTAQTISGLNFQPDLIWIKQRTGAVSTSHIVVDSVRGSSNVLVVNGTAGDQNLPSYVTGFTSSGFSVGNGSGADINDINTNNNTYVAWCWKANGSSTVTNNNGTITTQVSANPTAGFSIATYSGTDSGSSQTIGHGLGKTPKMWWIKNRRSGSAGNWTVTYTLGGVNYYMFLNSTQAQNAQGSPWSTLPTSSVVTLGVNDENTCNAGDTYVGYFFAEIEGYSKLLNWTGNGSTQFLYCGFRPRWIIFKRTGTTETWVIVDAKRDTFNPVSKWFGSTLAGTENSQTLYDFTSTGIRLLSSSQNENGSGYIAWAIAETPFKYARAR